MDWKEFVVHQESCDKLFFTDRSGDLYRCTCGADHRAEACYKQGIKEVVDFVKEGGYLMGDKWQAQVKDWGINP